MPRSCGYVLFCGKRKSADVIKMKDLEMDRWPGIIWRAPTWSQGSLKVEEGGRREDLWQWKRKLEITAVWLPHGPNLILKTRELFPAMDRGRWNDRRKLKEMTFRRNWMRWAKKRGWSLEAKNGKEIYFPLEPLKRDTVLPALGFSPLRLRSDVWPVELKIINLCCWKLLRLWSLVTAALETEYGPHLWKWCQNAPSCPGQIGVILELPYPPNPAHVLTDLPSRQIPHLSVPLRLLRPQPGPGHQDLLQPASGPLVSIPPPPLVHLSQIMIFWKNACPFSAQPSSASPQHDWSKI